MMQRYIPFGYKIHKGEITVKAKEADTVRKIFEMYCEGQSYNAIAKYLSAEKIKYNGNAKWNKHVVKRILENERLYGNEIYPQIINHDLFEKAAAIREQRARQFGYRKSNATETNQSIPIDFYVVNPIRTEQIDSLEEAYIEAQLRYSQIKEVEYADSNTDSRQQEERYIQCENKEIACGSILPC